ncbi:hypothetical protein [Paludisphaera rhizosphaerae]|uniref:hypothetical protein n=1 Tax=Paludisphaera rhizosphaerae TaxID=2711216 RepID=UPI0013EAB8E8|nr:hypothetical protein [Paludisphaera rhizosphaerae]
MNRRTWLQLSASAAIAPRFANAATARSAAEGVEQARGEIRRRFLDRHGVMVDFTGLDGSVDLPTPDECRAGKPNALGWFQPIENGSMFNGLYMDAAVNAWRRSRTEADAAEARRLMEGLLLLNSVSDQAPGFVARGVSTDGRSHFPMGSNDQTGPWFYGLWRYWRDGPATDEERRRIVSHFLATAEAVIRLGWKMPAEPPYPTRGTFAGFGFDDAPRPLFVLRALHAMTGDAAWERRCREMLDERGPEGRTRREVCERGMVYTYAPTHAWTSCVSVAALRGLWEMEDDPAARAAFARGLAASARLAAGGLPVYARFDPADRSPFTTDWRQSMMPLWKPQADEREAQALAQAQVREFEKASPRRRLENAFIREPTAAAWIVSLAPDADLVRSLATEIARIAAHYDYSKLHYCTFFWIVDAWLRTEVLKAE